MSLLWGPAVVFTLLIYPAHLLLSLLAWSRPTSPWRFAWEFFVTLTEAIWDWGE